MRNKKCFTLLEMLITIAIIGVLTASIIISKQSNQSREDLLNAAKMLALDVRKAQNYAMNSALESGEVPCGYGMNFNYSPPLNRYIIFYEIMNPASLACNTSKKFGSLNAEEEEFAKETIDFNLKKIKIDSIAVEGSAAAWADLFFSPPDPVFYVNAIIDKQIKITLKVDGKTCPSDYCKSILVNPLGQVSVE